MNKLILTEYYEIKLDPDMLAEAKKTGGPLVLKDCLLQLADTKNANGRIYPGPILEREVKRFKQLVDQRMALGELDHPDSPIVELKNVCMLISDIWMKGGEVRGNIEVLNTPSGKVLRSLAEQNIKLGVSSRGIGSVEDESDHIEVQEDFELITFDAVSTPSTPGAYLVNENATSALVDRYGGLRSVVHDILGDNYFK